jgi:hypothetical protein
MAPPRPLENPAAKHRCPFNSYPAPRVALEPGTLGMLTCVTGYRSRRLYVKSPHGQGLPIHEV